MSAYVMLYVCEKEEVVEEVDKTISGITKFVQGELLTIHWDPVCEGYCMFEREFVCTYFIGCVLLNRYQQILQRNRKWKRPTQA